MELSEITDATLIDQCLSGDGKAWEALLTRYERLIYHTALRAGASPTDADDVFQSVCMIWLEELGRLRDPERLGAWLVTITRRECRGRWRHSHKLDDATVDLVDGHPSAEESPEALAGKADDARHVKAALEQMGDPCRSLLHLLYFDPSEPSYADIARKLRITPNSLGPTRMRCLEKLKEILEKMGW